jgi:hypothetical protein
MAARDGSTGMVRHFSSLQSRAAWEQEISKAQARAGDQKRLVIVGQVRALAGRGPREMGAGAGQPGPPERRARLLLRPAARGAWLPQLLRQRESAPLRAAAHPGRQARPVTSGAL